MLEEIAAGPGRVVAIARVLNEHDETPTVLTSTDGVAWQATQLPPAQLSEPFHIAFGNGLFVAELADKIISSTDGITWSDTPSQPTGALSLAGGGVAFASSKFVAWTASYGAFVSDGTSPWQVATGIPALVTASSSDLTIESLYAVDSGFELEGEISCCAAEVRTFIAANSLDGINWTKEQRDRARVLLQSDSACLSWVPGQLQSVRAGSTCASLHSPAVMLDFTPHAEITDNGSFIFGGNNGIFLSHDGVSFTQSVIHLSP